MTPNFELSRDFCTVYPPPSFISSYVYSFRSYHVDKQTHKQTPLKTSNALRYATTLANYWSNQDVLYDYNADLHGIGNHSIVM